MFTRRSLFTAVSFVALTGAFGCAADSGDGSREFGPGAGVSVADELAQPAALSISVEQSEAYLGERVLPLVSGRVTVAADGESTLTLSELVIDVGEMKFYGEEPLGTLELRDIKVRLDKPVSADAHWNTDRSAGSASMKLDLLLEWKMVTKAGKVVPLATQRLDDAHVDVGVHVDEDGQLTAEFAGGKEGTVLAWSELVELSNLAFDIRATR